jgi:hypothetical protein
MHRHRSNAKRQYFCQEYSLFFDIDQSRGQRVECPGWRVYSLDYQSLFRPNGHIMLEKEGNQEETTFVVVVTIDQAFFSSSKLSVLGVDLL